MEESEKEEIREDTDVTSEEENNKIEVEEMEPITEVVKNLNSVIDVSFSMNTSQSGQSTFLTDVINGKLCALIIDTEIPIQVRVSLSEYDDIVLYDDVNFVGTKYLPLGTESIFSDGDKLKYSLTDWILNNRLRFEIKGTYNTTVNFTIRYI